LAQKRTKHIIHEDEVEIGSFQLQLMFGSTWKEDNALSINTIFCDCGSEPKLQKALKVNH